jgi:predicted CXXCH cytochrome family protein
LGNAPDPAKCIECHADKKQACALRDGDGCTACHVVIQVKGATVINLTAPSKELCFSCHTSIKTRAEFGDQQSPKSFGNEYLTYILWAISPEGRAINLGEVLVGDNGRSKLEVTTDLQAFALIVTAEPYYAVRQPSDVIVLQNVVRDDTKGTTESVNASYELMKRGGYIPTGYTFDPVILNARLPLEFFEARNALRIAESEGAQTYASDSYQYAVKLMKKVDEYASSKHIERKQLIAVAREEVQNAEDSRAIAIKKMDAQRLANEQQASADAQAALLRQADDAIKQRNQAESDMAKAQAAKARAESDAMNAQAAKSQALADAATARNQALDAEAATAQANTDLVNSQAAAANALSAAQADAEKARLAAQRSSRQADADKADLRAKLSVQLNSILQTRDSARGLIVSMSDVLFDTGKYSLKSGAREKLAKVAGILLAYPGLNIEVGGHTDNVGGDELNQILSSQRAGSVRDYLVTEGVATGSVTDRDFAGFITGEIGVSHTRLSRYSGTMPSSGGTRRCFRLAATDCYPVICYGRYGNSRNGIGVITTCHENVDELTGAAAC